MSRIALCLAVFALVFIVPQLAEAQSPEMPIPGLVLVDADGKPMAQVVDVGVSPSNLGEGLSVQVTVVFDFDDNLAAFTFMPGGDGGTLDANIFLRFMAGDCTGQPHMSPENGFNYPTPARTAYFILGPDSVDGTYRVYRTTQQPAAVPFETYLNANGDCLYDPISTTLSIAEEINPNPLEGYHGPTAANPERVLTIKGGTRLP